MFVVVDLDVEPAEVTLAEADDCARFHLQVQGHGHAPAVDDALQASGTGWLDGEGSAFVRVERLRDLAAGQVSADWDERFAAMLDYAKDKGWVSEDGGAVRAHLESN